MLRVRLEILPFGDENKAYEIGRLDIFNEGRLVDDYCSYGVIDPSSKYPGLYAERILHKRSLGAWRLVMAAIDRLKIEGP